MEAVNSLTHAGQVSIGQTSINRIGLGTNRLTDTETGHQLLRRAVELGVNFIDTAYRYQNGSSERAIGNTLPPYEGIVVATKGGWDDTRPDALPAFLEESLAQLKTDHIDLYQLHRINPKVPIEESMAVFRRFLDQGKIRAVGLSEVTVQQLERARQVVPIASVQNEYNVLDRRYDDVVDYCTRNNLIFIPWFPLGGLAGGAVAVAQRLADTAVRYNVTPQQVALAWLLRRSPIMLPIPGTVSLSHLEANMQAGSIAFSETDYEELTNTA